MFAGLNSATCATFKKTMKTRRIYSEEEKAAALTVLDFHRGNVKRAARAAGLPRKTLSSWRNGRGVSAKVVSIHTARKTALADEIENTVRIILDQLPAKIPEASLMDAAKSLGILIDRMLILRGMPNRLTCCPSCSSVRLAG